MTSSTAWPAGVIAPYKTHVGGYVDITTEITDGEPYTYNSPWRQGESLTQKTINASATATCSGCTDTHTEDADGVDDEIYVRRQVEKLDPKNHLSARIRGWAQSHAETCRALPNPNA